MATLLELQPIYNSFSIYLSGDGDNKYRLMKEEKKLI